MAKNVDALLLAEPVEQMYADCVALLLENLAKHFSTGKGMATAEWQLKKLQELGKLTDESVAIIQKTTGMRTEVITDIIYTAVFDALQQDEEAFSQALLTGKLQTSAGPLETSERVAQVISDYTEQAKEATNLVNTVMLQSVQDRYRQAIAGVVAFEEAEEIERLTNAMGPGGLAAQMGKAQRELNTAAGSVNLGITTRQQAIRQAIANMAKIGITGFIDRGGHHWSPEAYVSMDVRTTVHNTAIQAQKTRSAEYGVDTFQISTKAVARPLCAPYQGWVCSWTNRSGTIRDLYGNEYPVHPISETSYGEPAGVFGINCGHFPETFVDGYSVPRYEQLTPDQMEANETAYKRTQQQRAMERKIRSEKTAAAMFDAAGDKEEFARYAQRVKVARAQYLEFCDKYNLPKRLDRTQVFGYNRSVSSKANWAARQSQTTELPKTLKLADETLKQAARANFPNM